MQQQTTITVHIEGSGPAAQRALEAIRSVEGLTDCPICGGAVPRKNLERHELLPEPVCPLCLSMAEQVLGAFRDAARRTYREFKGQFRGIVRLRRAGMDSPTFYQGFEG